jgi:hypothetical protein
MSSDGLAGSWQLLSWQVECDGQSQPLFGSAPKGVLILTPEGRVMALTTAAERRAGDSMEQRATLHRTMVAYSGRYRVAGDEFITTVEVSWNEAWNGTEQRRHYRIEGDLLHIESAPAPSLFFPGMLDVRRLVWRREQALPVVLPETGL